MKRLLVFCTAMLAMLTCNAQRIQVLKNGEVLYECSETEGVEVVFKERDPYNGHEYVDLGLPSGLKWATVNIGASKPEEYGDYFAWGDPEPYYTEGHSQDNPISNWNIGKTGYGWASYKWCNGSYNTHTKYCTTSYYGTVDNKTTLDQEDDAAHVKWGGDWRMPTKEEQDELRTKCSWSWTSLGGIMDFVVRGPNGNSIFLPTAGSRSGTYLNYTRSRGYYWSSSLHQGYAYSLYFSNANEVEWRDYQRCDGLPVRAVCP